MRLSFDRLWIWIAIALPALAALLVPLPAVDLAYQVRAGDEILAARALPVADTWTFTVWGTRWVDQQWLAQVKLAAGYAVGGWELLAVLRAGLVAFATGVLVAVARERGASPRTAAVLSLAAFTLAAPALALRPQLFGIALFAVLLWLIAVRARSPRLYLLAPVIVALWANVHGSFVLGPALMGYAWLSDVAAKRPARVSLWILVLGTLATLVNPYLAGAWLYAASIGANPAIAGQVSEWQRTMPFAMPGVLFYPSVVVTLMLMLRRRDLVRWPDWVLVAAMGLMGAWAVRGVAWWACVMVFVLAGVLASERPARVRRASAVNGLMAIALGLAIVVALPWWRPPDPLTGRTGLLSYAPTGLATKVAELAGTGARVVVPQTWGSWFEWAAPDQAYFIDSRFELFPAAVWADYAALQEPNGNTVLERWAADVVVVPAGDAKPAGAWDRAWEDADGSILVRAR
jgi:hypothetical protein